MKALILSAGLGTRLRPLIDRVPKTMMEIDQKPLLWYHIQNLKKHGIEDIWINLHSFPEIVMEYFGNGSQYNVEIHYSFEKELLGTSGSLKNPDSGIEKEFRKGNFLIIYGDNLTNFNYTKLIDFHTKKNSMYTIGLYETDEPWTMGVIETDTDDRIKKFIEKPLKEEIKTNTVSAGVMVCEPEIIDSIPHGFSDFGIDILPKLLDLKKTLWALNTNSYVQDIGTFERLEKARDDYKKGRVTFDRIKHI